MADDVMWSQLKTIPTRIELNRCNTKLIYDTQINEGIGHLILNIINNLMMYLC